MTVWQSVRTAAELSAALEAGAAAIEADLISGGVFVIPGARVDDVVNAGPVTP